MYNEPKHIGTKHKNTKNTDAMLNYIKHINITQMDTKRLTLSIIPLSIMTLSTMTLSMKTQGIMTLCKDYAHHYN
jgi:hypothetical protein